jgi:peptidyl-tRNA hydrolase
MDQVSKYVPPKMYILVRDSIPAGFCALGAAHASVACYVKFKDIPEVQDWLKNSFRKVVCRVSDAEFDEAKRLDKDHVLITEDAINDEEIALAFRPRADWPQPFKSYKLFA